MWRIFIVILALSFANNARGSNLKISQYPKIISIDNSFAVVEIELTWNNSWRNEYNYDAVYLFGKYRTLENNAWYHIKLVADDSEILTAGYRVVENGAGLLVFPDIVGERNAKVKLRVKWAITGNSASILTPTMFDAGQVMFDLAGMEMVYIPTASFYAGDGLSEKTFGNPALGGIPAEYDIIGANSNFTYTASASPATAPNVCDRRNFPTYHASYVWTAAVPAWWQVDFKSPKKIRYFGVSGGYWTTGIETRSVPAETWYLEGSNDAASWQEVWSGGPEHWSTTSTSYPIQHAIRISTPAAYRYYRIRIPAVQHQEFWSTVQVNNVAMTEYNIDSLLTGPLLVDAFEHNLPENYPNGFHGFWAMKYEVTQEQYVSFLNKLTYEQQYRRTTANYLDRIGEGKYIFGQDPEQPTARNGIILAYKPNESGIPLTFACDLNPINVPNAEDDGQTLACNFLTPEDMLAYADWVGLRPMSEMEYEKMCRAPFPLKPVGGNMSWGNSVPVKGGDLKEQGYDTEYFSSGNVNAGNAAEGPVRVGAFTRLGRSREQAGISFWGIEGLTGNVAEMYYNTGAYGRQLNGTVCGDGMLDGDGCADVEKIDWTINKSAFGIRGGSYASENAELAVSDRRYAEGYFPDVNERKPTVGFRLGLPVEQSVYSGVLILENGFTSQNGLVRDTVCSASEYCIRGSALENQEACLYTWYRSTDGGSSWQRIKNATGKDILLRNLVSEIAFGSATEYLYKRYVSSPIGSGESGTAALTIGHGFTINRLRDTLIPCQEIKGFEVKTPLPSTFQWILLENEQQLAPDIESAMNSKLKIVTNDLKKAGEEWPNGIYVIDLTVQNRNKGCAYAERLEIFAHPRTTDPFTGTKTDFMQKGDSYYIPTHTWTGKDSLRWGIVWDECGYAKINENTGKISYLDIIKGDNTDRYFTVSLTCREIPSQIYTKSLKYICRSCLDYYNAGARTNGMYTIDPDGPGGLFPYSAQCDMVNGGWTRFTDINNGWQGFPGNSRDVTISRITNHVKFVALASASTQQKLTSVQGASEGNYDYYYFLNYAGGCASGSLPCNVSGGWGPVANVIFNINKNWGSAMYKTRFRTDGSNNSGAGTYFVEMWFK